MTFNKKSVHGFFDFVKTFVPLKTNDNPNGFYFLPKYFFDSKLDFENELKRYTVANNTALNLQKIKWLAFVWSRSAIDNNTDTTDKRRKELLRRDLTNPEEPKGTFDGFGMVSCPINARIYCNDLDVLESFEEYFHVYVKNQTTFNVSFSEISVNPTKVLIRDLDTIGFIKLDRNDNGDICYLDTSLKLVYPIALNDRKGIRPLIGQGKIEVVTKVLKTTDPFPIP